MTLLLQNGHDESRILDYSVEKFNLYVSSAFRLSAEGRVAGVVDTVVSISGALSGKGNKVLSGHLDSLGKFADDG